LFSVAEDLQRERSLPDSNLGETFRFAVGIEEITTLEEASSLLLLEELKVFAKEAKVQGKSKKELLAGLRETSQTQRGLKDTNNRDGHFTQKILDFTGGCIRLSSIPRALFERVHLVFYRSTEWTEKSLTTIILAKMSKRNFPEYIVCRSNSIFSSREALLEFEAAIQTQFAIDNILEFNGPPTTESLQQIIDLANKFHPRWKELVNQEQQKEDSIYESGEGAYLRRFSPAWVFTRIIHKSLHPLGRFKEHKREHEVLEELLAQRLFHAARRGAWYQRKALLEEHYMAALTPAGDRSEENQRKHWKRIALKTCENGLEDPLCHLIFHYDLQKRITKLEKALRVVKREQHDFGHVMLGRPAERIVEGIRIDTEDVPRKGKATVWVDEREGGECRVESMCLSWYRDHGWKGYHSEGGIVRTLVSIMKNLEEESPNTKTAVWLPLLRYSVYLRAQCLSDGISDMSAGSTHGCFLSVSCI
jgi:Fanconi-associated nuclease 1